MTGYLLDTNVISELTRDVPEPKVLAFLAGRDDVWLSSILIHEVEYGVRLLPRGERRSRLSRMQAGFIATYGHRILTLDRAGAEWAAEFRASARRSGHPVDLVDVLIAGIAKANALTVASRNVADFRPLDIEVVNPWDAPRPEASRAERWRVDSPKASGAERAMPVCIDDGSALAEKPWAAGPRIGPATAAQADPPG